MQIEAIHDAPDVQIIRTPLETDLEPWRQPPRPALPRQMAIGPSIGTARRSELADRDERHIVILLKKLLRMFQDALQLFQELSRLHPIERAVIA
jgi:hypothetical protein